jgi:hypothetical protein
VVKRSEEGGEEERRRDLFSCSFSLSLSKKIK